MPDYELTEEEITLTIQKVPRTGANKVDWPDMAAHERRQAIYTAIAQAAAKKAREETLKSLFDEVEGFDWNTADDEVIVSFTFSVKQLKEMGVWPVIIMRREYLARLSAQEPTE